MTSKNKKLICKWCKKPFTIVQCRETNAIKYCSDDCRHNAKLEQNNKAQQRFKLKYRWLFKDTDPKGRLGESKLNEHPKPDFKEEYEEVHKEYKRRLKI